MGTLEPILDYEPYKKKPNPNRGLSLNQVQQNKSPQ